MYSDLYRKEPTMAMRGRPREFDRDSALLRAMEIFCTLIIISSCNKLSCQITNFIYQHFDESS